MTKRPFQFDPRDLISGPYRTCPNCRQDAFGVISINGSSYARRCRVCWHSATFPLWPVQKKLVYLDQFAISNMMKALDVEAPGHERAKGESFWARLFEALERVVRLQQVICPDSETHRHESMLSPFYKPLKQMYEHFSHGVTFRDSGLIARTQLSVAATAWLKDEQPVYDLRPERVTSRDLHQWTGRFIISVNTSWPQDLVEAIREFRGSVSEQLTSYYLSLRDHPEKSFRYWYEHERNVGGKRGILEAIERYRDSLQQMTVFDYGKVYDSEGLDRYRVIAEVFLRAGVEQQAFWPLFLRFLDSDAFRDYPYSAIESRLFAGISQQFATGRRAPLDRGTSNDISMISALLPYCDAMFIDDRARALVQSIPLEFKLPYPTRLFSNNSREAFLDYLIQIERETDPVIVSTVADVYGDDWARPYLTMFENSRRRAHKSEVAETEADNSDQT